MTVVLGLNAYHGDSAAGLVVDGRLVAAAEEERFRRIKHWAGFLTMAIEFCLDAAGVRLADVDCIAINRDPRAGLWRKAVYAALRRPDPAAVRDRIVNARQWLGVGGELRRAFSGAGFKGRICHVEHHRAHLASAFLFSPFEEAVAASIDGFGDFASAAWGLGKGNSIEIDGRVRFPHSLGNFYQALTQYLGFAHYGDEYKVMGLAAYGTPDFADAIRRIVRPADSGSYRLDLKYFVHHRERVDYEWNGGPPRVGRLYSPVLADLLGPPRQPDEPIQDRHKAIAASLQLVFEEAVFRLYDAAHERYRVDALALAGGCAFNSLANGRIRERTRFKRGYVQAAAGDAGGAIGAAMHVALAAGDRRGPPMAHAYWGPGFDDRAVADLLQAKRRAFDGAGCAAVRLDDEAELCRRVAQAIADGKVVGWFQGRMEWGPRALGNRSILADPRRADVKDILNRKIKRRESFRPFAPAILREAVGDWFETDADVPFMTEVFKFRPAQRARVPAVVHVDGTGRLQTVTEAANPRFHRLISAFARITGVPMVVNTSFNENEPIVCRPAEALDCFLRTRMDMLVLGNHVVERADRGGPGHEPVEEAVRPPLEGVG
jgi:carbamoyltransferase